MKKVTIFLISMFFIISGVSIGFITITTPRTLQFNEVQAKYVSSELFLLDYSGQLLHQWRQNKDERSFSWTRLKDISPTLVSSVLKSEDRKFFSHRGVDYTAVFASAYQRLFKSSPRGSSTISMQLAKLVADDPKIYRGFLGKMRQFWGATLIETSWSKGQILEAYLNLVPFRGEYRGLAGITWALFFKKPSGLTLTESTLLAVLIRSPNAKASEWSARACWQEKKLCNEFQSLTTDLTGNFINSLPDQYALHLAQRFHRDGYKGEVVTSIRKDLQIQVIETVQSQIRRLKDQNVHDAAVIVMENATGEVWAYVGGSGLQLQNNYVDGVQAFRQVGSTLKPFLYATAFEKKLLTPNSWIEDSAVDIVFDQGVYTPQNHDRQFYGWVQIKTALASSLNVPAVKTYKLLNDESFWNKLRELGFRNLRDSEHYGPALALGVADISLEDLTQAYRVLARQGLYSPLSFVPELMSNKLDRKNLYDSNMKPKRVIEEKSANMITQILSESQYRALGFGLDSTLSLPGAAVKTGTSKDMRDNWCIGYNSRFTVGVWVGNFSGEPMWNVMGITGAAPIWKKVMEYLDEKYPSNVAPKLTKASAITELPEEYPQIRISYPQDGMVIALDPSIPIENQKMPLLTEGSHKERLTWKIDRKSTLPASQPQLWTPTLGKHIIELYKENELAQSIQINVR